jgi:8-oxo-dGTP diphosphatase
VSALLLTADSKLVIQLRDDKPDLLFPAHWATLGGAIENGETPDEAINRELAEEIEPAPPVTFWRCIDHQFEDSGKQHTVENHIYVGDLPCPLNEIKLYEGQRLAAFSADEIHRLPLAYGLGTVFKTFFDEYRGDEPR